jgi:hypothetical protein
MNSNAQILFDYRAASATGLARIAWIDLRYTPTSIFSFVRCELHKLIPCGIGYGFGETMILEHPSDVQVFKCDEGKSIDQLSALLMGKISALVGYALVYVRYYLAPLPSLWTALYGCAQFLLSMSQSLFIRAKEFRISNRFTCRQRGKVSDSHVYANCASGLRQCLMLDFYREAGKPFARRCARDCERLDFALYRAMELDFDIAYFRELELARRDRESRLRECEAIVSSARTEARKAGFLTCFGSAKESVKGFIQSPQSILQYLGVNLPSSGRMLLISGNWIA